MFAALAALSMGPLMAQTTIDLTRQARLESGSQLPAQCSLGQLFLQSDPPAASTLYVCTAANNWSGPVVYSAGTGIAITGTSIATEDAVVPLYYAGTGAPALNCVAGRDYYVDTNAGTLYYCKNNGTWQPLSNVGHTHVASDVTSGVFNPGLLPSGIVWTNQTNTYTAGQTQLMSHNASNAGLRLVPAAGDPASAQDGDLWYNSTTGTFRQHQNGVVSDWGSAATHQLLSTTHSDTTPANAVRGDVITAQGAAATVVAPGSRCGRFLPAIERHRPGVRADSGIRSAVRLFLERPRECSRGLYSFATRRHPSFQRERPDCRRHGLRPGYRHRDHRQLPGGFRRTIRE